MSKKIKLNLLELGFVKIGHRELRFPSGARYQVCDDGRVLIHIEGHELFTIPGATIGSAANTLRVPTAFLN